MSIRLDPRRLSALKLLAAEAGVRPGELVTSWVEERLDAARPGSRPPTQAAPDGIATLVARLDELSRRVDALTASPTATSGVDAAVAEPVAEAVVPVKRGPGRPRKTPPTAETAPPAKPQKRATRKAAKRVAAKKARMPLHDEIAAVIAERGPQTAAELSAAIVERGNYAPPRSAKPLDAASVNARVSNPKYRPLFVRREGRIGLAE
ncbi:MAG: hypothetical protein OEW24_00750 [Chloroflexota bacterium]|nr:hypothetical protein [Chloroflexota bacterium]